ncbi:MAG: hypothetical protein QOJ56_6174 [Mycobacterium sp.]|nr:hypothetical protein [Mycobacterium sp.]
MRFTVHRPASAEVSPCCHRPSGGDVACGVHVGVARLRTAGDALENRLALAVFRRDMTAIRASLRRVGGRDKFEAPDSFVLQPGNQQSPALTVDLSVESPFLRDICARTFDSTARRAGHGRHIQVLDADGREATRQIGAGLLHPVTAAICFTGAKPGNGQLGSCAPMRSEARSGQAPLQAAQPLGFISTKARGVQQLSGGQRCRHRHASINADYAAVVGSRDRWRDGSKCDVPAARAIQIHAVGLHRVGDVAGPAESHPADLGHPYLPVAAAEPPNVARFHTDLPKTLVLAGLTPGWASVGAIEVVAHRLGEVPQRLLLHGLRPGGQPVVFGAGRRQLSTLLLVTRRCAAWLPMLLLLYGQIPHKPGMATVPGQHNRLFTGGKHPQPAHCNNINATTDNLPKGEKRRLLPCLDPGVSTPQIQ